MVNFAFLRSEFVVLINKTDYFADIFYKVSFFSKNDFYFKRENQNFNAVHPLYILTSKKLNKQKTFVIK